MMPNKEHGRCSARCLLLVLAIIAGQLQNALQSIAPSIPGLIYVDDFLVLLAVIASARYFARVAGLPGLFAAGWFATCVGYLGLTVLAVPTSFEVAFFLFRQIAIPALLVLVGLTLERSDWQVIIRLVIVIALIDVAYVALEVFIQPPIDPTTYAHIQGYDIYSYTGLPANYHGNNYITGERVIRAGGILLNPPTMGLFFGIAAIFAWNTLDNWVRWPITVSLVWALYMTFGRGGALVAVIAFCAPPLFRRIGAWATIFLFGITGLMVGSEVIEHGATSNHSNGLLASLRQAFETPFGRGFGYLGNNRDVTLVGSIGAESLLGIAFSAMGIGAIMFVFVAFSAYVHQLREMPSNFEAAVGIGILTAALLVESASALNGTVPIWLALGVAFSSRARTQDASIPEEKETAK